MPPAPADEAPPHATAVLATRRQTRSELRAWRLALQRRMWRPMTYRLRVAPQLRPVADSKSKVLDNADAISDGGRRSLSASTLRMRGAVRSPTPDYELQHPSPDGGADGDGKEDIEEVEHSLENISSWMPTELLPPDSIGTRKSWTAVNTATGAKVEVLFCKKAFLVKRCPVASFPEGTKRKDGGRQVHWSYQGDFITTWRWLAAEIGWASSAD